MRWLAEKTSPWPIEDWQESLGGKEDELWAKALLTSSSSKRFLYFLALVVGQKKKERNRLCQQGPQTIDSFQSFSFSGQPVPAINEEEKPLIAG